MVFLWSNTSNNYKYDTCKQSAVFFDDSARYTSDHCDIPAQIHEES